MKMNKYVYVILLMQLIISASISMVQPVTPKYLMSLNMPDYFFGLSTAALSFGMFVSSPIWGKWTDTKDRRILIIISLVGYAVSQLMFGLSSDLNIILFFRFTSGVFQTVWVIVSLTYLIDYSNGKDLAKVMGWNVAIRTIGTSLGSFIGGYLGSYTILMAFYGQFITLILISLITYWIIPKNDVNKAITKEKKNKEKFSQLNKLAKYIVVLAIILSISHSIYNSSINYFLADQFDFTSIQIGNYNAIKGGVVLVASLWYTPYIVKKLNPVSALRFSIGWQMLAILIFTLLYSPYMIVFGLMYMFFSTAVLPILRTAVAQRTNINQGATMGFLQQTWSLGMMIGALISGFSYDLHYKQPYIILIMVLLIAFMLTYYINSLDRKLNKIKTT